MYFCAINQNESTLLYKQVNPKLRPYIYFWMNRWAYLINLFFVKRMDVTGLENIPKDKPLILAGTHANSFYDAIVLHLLIKGRHVHALARGDAFNKGWVSKVLDMVYIIPVWRITEGKSNMQKNEYTFQKCHQLLKENKVVLIYPEGVCKNQTTLLPIKRSGITRLASDAWAAGIDAHIVPIVSNYDSFKKFGKRINLSVAPALTRENYDISDQKALGQKLVNDLTAAMEPMINHEFKPVSFFRNPFYYIGWVINFPLYFIINKIAKAKFGRTVFFDSVFYGFMYVSMAFYWIILATILSFIF